MFNNIKYQLLSVVFTPFGPNTPNSIPEPSLGSRDEIAETISYLADKVSSSGTMFNKHEFGYFDKSHLWEYRIRNNSGIVIDSEIFLPGDLDPTTGSILTRTSQGQTYYFAQFKCTNNKQRCVGWATMGMGVDDTLKIPCQNEQDAERVGRAMVLLIAAYGGQAEMDLPKFGGEKYP